MSWDIVLFNSSQRIETVADLDERQLAPTDFSNTLEKSFSNIKRDDNHREIIGPDFTIDFFPDDEPSSNFLLHLYGKTDFMH